jgi:uncharacterized protein YjbJ (UPF0337 family)
MLQDVLENTWKQLRGQVTQWWEGFSDDELVKAEAARDRLITLLQEKYGYGLNRAEKVVDQYLRPYNKTLQNAVDNVGQTMSQHPWLPLVIGLGLGYVIFGYLRRPSRPYPYARTTIQYSGRGRNRRVRQPFLP